jgi:two-component system, NarL family, invasion response regulator UvrY
MKILLVEDSDAIRVRLRALIGEMCKEATFLEARGESEGTQLACQERPDLIILDINLADGNGFGVLNSAARCTPASRVAVLTGHAENPYRKRSMASGAEWFFDKVHGFDDMCQTLSELFTDIGSGRQISATGA